VPGPLLRDAALKDHDQSECEQNCMETGPWLVHGEFPCPGGVLGVKRQRHAAILAQCKALFMQSMGCTDEKRRSKEREDNEFQEATVLAYIHGVNSSRNSLPRQIFCRLAELVWGGVR
jgi:hypothetical protein